MYIVVVYIYIQYTNIIYIYINSTPHIMGAFYILQTLLIVWSTLRPKRASARTPCLFTSCNHVAYAHVSSAFDGLIFLVCTQEIPIAVAMH